MIKKIILIFLLSYFTTALLAQSADLSPSQVPKQVTDNFMKENPGLTPAWKADGKNYKAFYTDPKTKMGQLIVYDDKGTVIRKESELDKLNYPVGISEYHSKNYPNEDYKIWSVKDKTGVGNYYSERNKQILWFDKNGNYVVPKDKSPETK